MRQILKNRRNLFIAGLIAVAAIAFYLTKTHQGLSYEVGPNGIWRDVQPFIDAHASTTAQRMALEQLFKEIQVILVHPEYGLEIKNENRADKTGRAYDCYWKIVGFENRIPTAEIQNAIVNTLARAKAFAKFNSNLSGGMYSDWNETKNGSACDFEIK